MAEIKRPTSIQLGQQRFGDREVGLAHPDTNGFIRLTDTGDIEIMANEGLGIILSANNSSITIIADQVKFVTREKNGLRWNDKAFNYNAYKFTEPCLVPYEADVSRDVFADIDNYLEE